MHDVLGLAVAVVVPEVAADRARRRHGGVGRPAQRHEALDDPDPLDDGDDDYLDRHVADDEANPLGRLQDQRMREALVEAIKHLPEREQYVMSMYYEHDMNLKEIAAVLKVTESRICQLHSQSIARLRSKLRAW